uniref:Uncharacterized protein n=1 Tax=Helianthus annuus TaxID=4232 RepID=A0A251S6Q8_HELAN
MQSTLGSKAVNSGPRAHILGMISWNHVKLALHRNVKVTLSKLRNGWNRRTHGISSN